MKDKTPRDPRLGSAGGQAVIEGVMMKSPEGCSVACRKEDGSVVVEDIEFHSVREKHKIAALPVIRGTVTFVESLILSYKTLSISAAAMGLEEEGQESKFEKWLSEHFGKGLVDVVMGVSMILGVALGYGLFFFLPIICTKGLDALCGGKLGWFRNLIEGVIKIAIFIGYMLAVSLMKDIRRTFEYHGAEHKTIFCYEAHEELTPENIRKYKRFHPRCGTSFLFVMLLFSILLYSLPIFTWDSVLLRFCTKILMLPVLMGVGYEFIRYAGRHDNALIRALSAPGLWMQRITTREPDDSQIEIAVIALKSCLKKTYPGFELTPEQKGVSAGDGADEGAEAAGSAEPAEDPQSADEA